MTFLLLSFFTPVTVLANVTDKDAVEVVQQQKKQTITGTVITGDTNEPAIGATVYLKNSTTGAITDINGKYSITIEGIGGVLEFSYIGYKKQEVAVNNQLISS